jgi:hypothetical protein
MIINFQGTPVEIGVSSHPQVTYTGNQLHIQTSDKSYSFPVQDVGGITFGKKQ